MVSLVLLSPVTRITVQCSKQLPEFLLTPSGLSKDEGNDGAMFAGYVDGRLNGTKRSGAAFGCESTHSATTRNDHREAVLPRSTAILHARMLRLRARRGAVHQSWQVTKQEYGNLFSTF